MTSPKRPPASSAQQRRDLLRQELEKVWPLLTYHYGLKPNELAVLPRMVIRAYVEALPRILAQEQLANIEAATFPKMKPAAQRSLSGRLVKQAGVAETQTVVPKSDDEFMANLAGIGIGLEMAGDDVELPEPEVLPDA